MSKSLAWVGAVLVLLAGVVALGVIWVVGPRVEADLRQNGIGLSVGAQLAFFLRPLASSLVLLVIALAAFELRRRPSVRFLVMLGLLQLSIAGAYGLAQWLPYRHILVGPIK